MRINEFWNSREEDLWKEAVDAYWGRIEGQYPDQLPLEREMDALDREEVARMDATEWRAFLREKYLSWKYTQPNRLVTTRNTFDRRVRENGLEWLANVRDEIFRLAPVNVIACFSATREILGPAGASGLLSLLFPEDYGTVDQFVVKALEVVADLPERDRVQGMKPDSLSDLDAAVLLEILRRKARELRETLGGDWTPRQVDMALWAADR